jgi:hypothetical protein
VCVCVCCLCVCVVCVCVLFVCVVVVAVAVAAVMVVMVVVMVVAAAAVRTAVVVVIDRCGGAWLWCRGGAATLAITSNPLTSCDSSCRFILVLVKQFCNEWRAYGSGNTIMMRCEVRERKQRVSGGALGSECMREMSTTHTHAWSKSGQPQRERRPPAYRAHPQLV